jgi:hypothetical protein
MLILKCAEGVPGNVILLVNSSYPLKRRTRTRLFKRISCIYPPQ